MADSPESFYSDGSYDIKPVGLTILKFGNDPLVIACEDLDQVQRLVAEGHPITANAIQAACFTASSHALENLLRESPTPNLRLSSADEAHVGVQEGWAASDITPRLAVDKRQWYPIQHAATGSSGGRSSPEEKLRRRLVLNVLLRSEPDLYAVFKQPILNPEIFPFPGEENTEKPMMEDDDDDDDDDDEPFDMVEGEWQRDPTPERGYGLRSVIHALFEDGAYVKPILEYPGLEIDPSRRDPQGRTLLHSVCRSSVGADATIDGVVKEVNQGNRNQELVAPETSESSLFHIIRKRGADVFATDFNGKTILHHLFEAQTAVSGEGRPPLICNTLQYIYKHASTLINQPDRHGTYPLHASLQRLRRYRVHLSYMKQSPLDAVVHGLLDAGADPTVRDSRGNTALHYLADNGIADMSWCSACTRTLLPRFLESNVSNVDVNVRNKLGRTALEILMDDRDVFNRNTDNLQWRSNVKRMMQEEIDDEIFEMFDKAGVKWTARDPKGQTLLHFVARHPTDKAAYRVELLLAKGVDPSLKDKKGKTVSDVAIQFDNQPVLELLAARVRQHDGPE